MHVFRRHFGGDRHPLTVSVSEGLAQHDFRGLVQIHISGVQIGDAPVNGPADQGNGLLFINNAVSGGRAVKAHAAQAEGGGLNAQFPHRSVLH